MHDTLRIFAYAHLPFLGDRFRRKMGDVVGFSSLLTRLDMIPPKQKQKQRSVHNPNVFLCRRFMGHFFLMFRSDIRDIGRLLGVV